MVKKLLGALSLGLLLSAGASAQIFTLEPNDTIEVNTTGQGVQTQEGFSNTLNIEAFMTNASTESQTFRWKLLSDSTEHPAGWILTGICDNVVCRLPYSPFYYGVEQEAMPVAAGGNSLLEVRLYCPPPTGNGTGVIRVQVRTLDAADTNVVTQQDTMVFIVHKNAVGIDKIAMDDSRVSVYPNPAINTLQVYADKNLSPAQISVTNIAGAQKMTVGVDKGKDVTTLDINALASGIYMIRVTDISGAVITTRKFAKQ